MANSHGPVIDMTPDGAFIEPPKPSLLTIVARLGMFAVSLGVLWLVFRALAVLLPVFLVLAVVGYFVLRNRIQRLYVVSRGPVFRR